MGLFKKRLENRIPVLTGIVDEIGSELIHIKHDSGIGTISMYDPEKLKECEIEIGSTVAILYLDGEITGETMLFGKKAVYNFSGKLFIENVDHGGKIPTGYSRGVTKLP